MILLKVKNVSMEKRGWRKGVSMKNTEYIQVISDIGYSTSSWYLTYIDALSKAANKGHRQIQLFSGRINASQEKFLGPIVIVMDGSKSFLNYTISLLLKLDIKIILAGIDANLFGPQISCITRSRKQETAMLIGYFFSHGYRDIAFVGFRKDGVNDMFRYNSEIKTSFSAEYLQKSSFFWMYDIDDCLNNFTERASQFNAVICPNDAFSIILLHRCISNGIRVPDDIFIGSFGGLSISGLVRPGITSCLVDYETIGLQTYNAWEIINANIDSNISLRIELPSRLAVRESTAYLPIEASSILSPLPENIEAIWTPDEYFENEDIKNLFNIEKCLSMCDDSDLKIIRSILDKQSYETISQQLFLSISSVNYRLNKIFKNAHVTTKNEFVSLLLKYIEGHNPL